MKVLYDHQIFEHQRIGGISRYFSEIIRHLPTGVKAEVSVQYSFNEYLKNLNIPFIWKEQLMSDAYFMSNWNFKGKKRLFSYIQKIFPSKYPDIFKINRETSIKRLLSKDFDIFHPTFYQDYYLDTIGDKPYVLTVHDMIIELYPEFVNSPGFVKRKKKLVDRAAHIIAVSENTKRDIVKVFGIPEYKISVTHHGASLQQTDKYPDDIPSKYLLYVGDRRLGYKNFAFFISSIQPLLLDNKDLCVLCTGDNFTNQEKSFFDTLNISNQMKIKFVDDKQMYNLYQSALMFIYPSYNEGFGIPILEAFQSKCPVVLSNASCFPEVAGNAGSYFDPKSPQDLRQAILSILRDKVLKENLIEKGTQRLKSFSWEKTAQQTVDIYKKVLAGSI